MNAEFEDALARFDDDVRLVCDATGQHVRRQSVAEAYREALATAAGVPSDAAWDILLDSVVELVRSVDMVRDHRVRAAIDRLAGFVAENGEDLERDEDCLATV
jgi:hypothetical protein